MSIQFKRRIARGFTLIELLIVVIILAIISAIAIPQFTASTADAQMSALDANLSAVRTALEQYRLQHTGNVYPGAADATGAANCPKDAGTADAAATAGTKEAMLAQLQYYSNAAGQTCTLGDATNYKYGPYLRQGLPLEPFSNSMAVAVVKTGAPVAVAKGTGWAYSTATGQFISANLDSDGSTGGRTYSQH